MLAAPATASPPEVGRAEHTYAEKAVQATNQIRQNRQRTTLNKNGCLQRFADRQAQAMVDESEMFHQDIDKVVRKCDLAYAGENVAFGYNTGRAVVREGWMRSSGHRANILYRGYRLLAVGAAQDDGVWYAAQVFGRG